MTCAAAINFAFGKQRRLGLTLRWGRKRFRCPPGKQITSLKLHLSVVAKRRQKARRGSSGKRPKAEAAQGNRGVPQICSC